MLHWTAKHTHNKSYIIKKATHKKLMHDNDKHQNKKARIHEKFKKKEARYKLSSW